MAMGTYRNIFFFPSPPYLDARLVLIMLRGCEIAKVAQLYIPPPCLSFVLPPLFPLSSPLPHHADYAPSLYSQWRGRNRTLSFEHERKKLKNNNKDNRSVHASWSVCLSLLTWRHFTRWGVFPSHTNLCAYLRSYFGCVWACWRGSWLSCLAFCLYLSASIKAQVDMKALMGVWGENLLNGFTGNQLPKHLRSCEVVVCHRRAIKTLVLLSRRLK